MAGTVTGVIVAGIQALLFFKFDFFRNNTIVDYGKINFILIGSLTGGGALVGDMVKSFIKRRLGKPPGKPWFPWDQLDWIAGAIIVGSIVYAPPVKTAIVTAILYVGVHLCSDRIVCRMGMKERGEVN